MIQSSKNILALVAACYLMPAMGDEELASIDPTSLRSEVRSFLEAETSSMGHSSGRRVEIEVGNIDPRLRLTACPQDLLLSLNGNGRALGRVQVKVQCAGDYAWTKYVPVEIKIFESVLVASHTLSRGVLLEESHLRLQELDISQLRRTPLFESQQAIGKELKHSLTVGSPVALESLRLPKVVQRGDMVQLVAETENLQVRQQAEALEDGEVGKLIDVRNTSSKLVVQAVVVAAGKVKIQL